MVIYYQGAGPITGDASDMKVHLQVDGSPDKVRESARDIAELGVDGLFTFEGPHDVFFPLWWPRGRLTWS